MENDAHSSRNCIRHRGAGGWWMGQCGHANLNGEYGQGKAIRGISWYFGGARGQKWDNWKATKMVLVNVDKF